MAAQSLGACNPLPFPMLTVSALSWLLYGLLLRDYYIFVPNLSGFVVGLYYTMACYVYADARQRQHMAWLLGGMLLFVLVSAMIAFLPLAGTSTGLLVMGIVNTQFLMLFYLSSLLTLGAVVRTRDASSLNPTLILATLVNCALWLVYGLVLGNPFIFYPNVFGIVCALVQMACILAFRKSARSVTTPEGVEEGHDLGKKGDYVAVRLTRPLPVGGEGEEAEFYEASL